jgi:hypothetical protein
MNQSNPTQPTTECTGELNCSACATMCIKRLYWHREIAANAALVLDAFHLVAPSMAEQFPAALGLQRAIAELHLCRKRQEGE